VLGKETEMAGVETEYRYFFGGHTTGGAQKSAVASDAQTEVGREIVIFKNIVGWKRVAGCPRHGFEEMAVDADEGVFIFESFQQSEDVGDIFGALAAFAENGDFHRLEMWMGNDG
jgi:hypothetical protein